MNTKEEILQRCTAKKYDMSPNATNSFTEDLLSAMQEFAKIDAIAFAEWKDKNFKLTIGGFIHVMGTLIYPSIYNNEQLYSLYQQSKINQP